MQQQKRKKQAISIFPIILCKTKKQRTCKSDYAFNYLQKELAGMERKPHFDPIRFAITPSQTIDTVNAVLPLTTILEQDLFYSAYI